MVHPPATRPATRSGKCVGEIRRVVTNRQRVRSYAYGSRWYEQLAIPLYAYNVTSHGEAAVARHVTHGR